MENSGILEECKVEVLGTKLSAINQAEDRDLFHELIMRETERNQFPESEIVNNHTRRALEFVTEYRLPGN